jgi:hypothetical protein
MYLAIVSSFVRRSDAPLHSRKRGDRRKRNFVRPPDTDHSTLSKAHDVYHVALVTAEKVVVIVVLTDNKTNVTTPSTLKDCERPYCRVTATTPVVPLQGPRKHPRERKACVVDTVGNKEPTPRGFIVVKPRSP